MKAGEEFVIFVRSRQVSE